VLGGRDIRVTVILGAYDLLWATDSGWAEPHPAGTRPNDLRDSAASLWLHEGRTIIEVATWMGHSGQRALSTYLHVMSDLGDERISAEDAIRAARTSSYPRAAKTTTTRTRHEPQSAS
jgi:integrase